MANFKEKIGIYGGSFNPIHYGHLKIAQLAIKTLLLDKLILVPSYQNTLKKVKPWHQISHDHRLAMLKLVLKPKMIISDYEIVHQINESYLTIDHFQKQYQDAEIFMIIGSDLLDGLTKWEKTTEISQKCQLVCFQRNKFIKTHPNISKYNIDLYHNKLFHISSTNYHKLLQLDFVPTIIQKYIGTNLLYFENYYQYLNAQE